MHQAAIISDLIAPCVMECYFREHMAERDLLFLRAKGPAPYQSGATPWVIHRKNYQSPEGATQLPRRSLSRPFRAQSQSKREPRAVPWAGMFRTVGASESQQRDFLTHLHQTLNATSHPIRDQLLRLTADSPDLLAIIKKEGKV